MPSLQPDPSRITEHRLTKLLDRWADCYRLDVRRAAAVHRAIVTSPCATDFERWWRLLDPVNGTAFRSSRNRVGVELTLPLSPDDLAAPQRLRHQETDFQPYLRL